MKFLKHNVWGYIGHLSYIRNSARIFSTQNIYALLIILKINEIYFSELHSVFGIHIHDELSFLVRLLDFCLLFG